MSHGMFLVSLGAVTLGITACSHTVPSEAATNPPTSVSSSDAPRWTASIHQSVGQNRFSVPDSTHDRSFGSAEWSRSDRPTLSSVNLVFAYGGAERELSWAILFGSCGSASLPVIPMSSFPELDVSSGGRGQVNATLSLEFPTSGTYHIDIYKDRRGGAESLVGCGNLKYR